MAIFPTSLPLSRRDVLRLGGLCGLGISLPELCAARRPGERAGTFGAAKQVIMLFLHGGHPQQETFDPKPMGPTDVRGEFGAISTRLPGVAFSELLPRIAGIADKLAVVRSMAHGNANHVQACLPAQTGHIHPPSFAKKGDFPPSSTDFPPIGAVLNHLRGGRRLPSWVRVGPLMRRSNGTTLHGQTPGFLGATHSSFDVDQSLLKPDVRIEALNPPKNLTSIRLSDRRRLQREFNSAADRLTAALDGQDLGPYYGRAFDLLTSPATRKAFRLSDEPRHLRERYGMTEFGQRCLLARRLAESGVPMVNVSYCHTPSGSWDTHGQNFKKMKQSLAPTLDQALTALVTDLDERGRLSDTLVIVNAEFGRTPKINRNSGRDHWPFVYSLALAGAGIKPGVVHGSSDKSAAYPASSPYDPRDMAATIYHLLGIAPETVIRDAFERPHRLIVGQPIGAILG